MRCLLLLPLLFLPLPAQTSESTLQALLNEVQQLRLAIERSTLLGVRTQIAMNRMQLHETRAARLSGELDGLRREIAQLQAAAPRFAEQIKDAEARLPSLTDPEARRQTESEIKMLKQELEQFEPGQQLRRARESELASQLQAEQSRLQESRDRITEMERALDAAIQQMVRRP